MSFQAKLRLDGDHSNEIVVLSCDYAFTQSIDSQNLPNGRPTAGIVKVTLASAKDSRIIEWMVSPKMTKFAVIAFKGKDGSTIRLVELTNTYCIGFREIFDADDANPMKTMLTLSAWDIRINILYGKTNDWAEFDAYRSSANKADSSVTPANGHDESYTYQPVLEPQMTNPTDRQVMDLPPLPPSPDLPTPPDIPAVPDVPSPPDIPAVPDVPSPPNIPSVPDIPQVPDPPSVPNIPSPPDLPTIPDPPSLPQVPDVPNIPTPPSLPNVPSPPDIPEPPTVPSFIP
jgi:hypothetical protein